MAVFADGRVRRQASPRFEKRYFDAVCGSADWWIGYDITLRFLGLAWNYREITSSREAGVRSSLTVGRQKKESERNSFCWRTLPACTAWDTNPVSTPIMYFGNGFRWTLEGIRGSFSDGTSDAMIENIYSESITLTAAPWSLGIKSLYWGRVITNDNYVVWIISEGTSPFCITVVNDSILADCVRYDIGGIASSRFSLQFGPTIASVTNEDVANSRSRLTHILARLALGSGSLLQNKRVTECTLTFADGKSDIGLGMIEEVTFLDD